MRVIVQRTNARALPADFEQLFQEHHGPVYRAAYRITGNAQDAEDVLQTLFLRLLHRGQLLDMNANPKGYLHRGAVNIALDIVRARRRSLSSDDSPGETAVNPSTDRIQGIVAQALSELSPKLAEMFVLKHVEGYDNSEIADLIGTSRGAVAVMLFRARVRLKKSIRVQINSTGARHES
jgi:RNA polymerase sigma-70 factor, ECF subfamily